MKLVLLLSVERKEEVGVQDELMLDDDAFDTSLKKPHLLNMMKVLKVCMTTNTQQLYIGEYDYFNITG